MAPEKRLIDANVLVEDFQKTKIDEVFPNWKDLNPIVTAAVLRLTRAYRQIILKAPTVDAVEVVRCKDCRHWQDCKVELADGTYRDYLPGEEFGNVTLDTGINVGSHCTLHGYENSSGSWFWAKPDDYCSRGERRTND